MIFGVLFLFSENKNIQCRFVLDEDEIYNPLFFVLQSMVFERRRKSYLRTETNSKSTEKKKKIATR